MRALMLIDIQKGLTGDELFNRERFLDRINCLIAEFRRNDEPIVWIQHENERLKKGTKAFEINDRVNLREDDARYTKNVGDAFSNTALLSYLKSEGVTEVIIGGIASSRCVRSSSLGGMDVGFDIQLIEDGHSLSDEGAEQIIKEVEDELFANGVKPYRV